MCSFRTSLQRTSQYDLFRARMFLAKFQTVAINVLDQFLICLACRQEHHVQHNCVHLNQFIKLTETKSLELDEYHPKNVFNQFLKQQESCFKILEKFREKINNQIDEISNTSKHFFESLQQMHFKEIAKNSSINFFNEMKSLQQFREQIKQILSLMHVERVQNQISEWKTAIQQVESHKREICTLINKVLINFNPNLEVASFQKEVSSLIAQMDQSHSLYHKVTKPKSFNNIRLHEGILIEDCIAKALNDGKKSKLILLQEFADALPLKDRTWKFHIMKCKNLRVNFPMAIGLCYNNIQALEFQGDSEIEALSGKKNADHQILKHQCYLVSCMGVIRNCAYSDEDLKQSGFRFIEGDIVELNYNPFIRSMVLKRKNKGQLESIQVSIEETKGFQLVPCVRFGSNQDMIRIIL